MQLTRYSEIVENIFELLKLKQIKDIIQPFLYRPGDAQISDSERNNIISLIFAARENLHGMKADPETEKIAQEMGMLGFLSIESTTQYVVFLKNAGTYSNFRENRDTFTRFASFYWCIFAVETQLKMLQSNVLGPRVGAFHEDEEILEFEAYESLASGFDPDQVAVVLSKIDPLFHSVAKACGLDSSKVKVAFFDSGSDLLIAIKATKELVREVRVLLTELLPLIRDWKSSKLSKKIETANGAVTLFRKIDQLQESGAMAPEAAARAKHDVMKSVSQLLGAGAYIREVKPAIVDYRSMLQQAAEIKLLEGPKPPSGT